MASNGLHPPPAAIQRTPAGLGLSAFIALQYGMQPFLAKLCIPRGTPTSSLVVGAELAKSIVCLMVIATNEAAYRAFRTWSFQEAVLTSASPALIYLVQNYCVQVAYQNLDGISFNVINQSKVLFTALATSLIVGRRQSWVQWLALVMVTIAGMLMSAPKSPAPRRDEATDEGQWMLGIYCTLGASALSGLGSATSQWAMQMRQRDGNLLSLEMALIGVATVYGSLLAGLSIDSDLWWQEGLYSRWQLKTVIPILTQGVGGLVVGVITKVAGGVQKVLATVCGLMLTCIVEQVLYADALSPAVGIALPLVTIGLLLHTSFPPIESKKVE